MTDSQHVAIDWLTTLAGRGVSVTVRNNRLSLSPGRAYAELSDDELLTLRHHREAIKTVVSEGIPIGVDARPNADVPNVEAPNVDVPAVPSTPEPCPYCRRHPCVGIEHHAFSVLHWNDPAEVKKRDDHNTAVMLKMLKYGNPSSRGEVV